MKKDLTTQFDLCSRCTQVVCDEDFRDNIAVKIHEEQTLCQSCQDDLWPTLTEEEVIRMEQMHDQETVQSRLS